MKTEQGSCQLPFCSPCTVRAEGWLWYPKLSFLPITDAVMVKGQLQQARSVETLYFLGYVVERPMLQMRCPYVSSLVAHCVK